MEAGCSSETSVNFYRTTRSHIPEYNTLHNLHSLLFNIENESNLKRAYPIVSFIVLHMDGDYREERFRSPSPLNLKAVAVKMTLQAKTLFLSLDLYEPRYGPADVTWRDFRDCPYAHNAGPCMDSAVFKCKSQVGFFLSFMGWGETWFYLVRRRLTGLLRQHRVIDDECGAVGGMRIGRENGSIRKKPTPVPLCSPQIPHDLTWARTWTAAA
jgi:hypothetical protein